MSAESEPVVCLACGGLVVEHGDALFNSGMSDQIEQCHCGQTSAQLVNCPACGGSLKVGARACPYCHSLVASKRCGDCLAWNLAEAKHCQECGGSLDDVAAKSTVNSSMKCPRCQGSLTARRYADLRALECDACGGMMLDVEMMTKVVEARDRSTALRLALPKRASKRETEVHYLTCPACKKSMNRKAFGRISGVVVDVCKTDGVWFDAGELGDVLAFVERGGLEEARQRELDDLHESKRALHAAEIQATAAAAMGTSTSTDLGSESRLEAQLHFGREILSALASLWS